MSCPHAQTYCSATLLPTRVHTSYSTVTTNPTSDYHVALESLSSCAAMACSVSMQCRLPPAPSALARLLLHAPTTRAPTVTTTTLHACRKCLAALVPLPWRAKAYSSLSHTSTLTTTPARRTTNTPRRSRNTAPCVPLSSTPTTPSPSYPTRPRLLSHSAEPRAPPSLD